MHENHGAVNSKEKTSQEDVMGAQSTNSLLLILLLKGRVTDDRACGPVG